MSGLLHTAVVTRAAATRGHFLFLHGIMGRGINLMGLAKDLAAQHPGWGAALVDLRLHGSSRGFAGPHTLAACGDDVRRLVDARFASLDQILIGHSFGGKVALQVATQAPATLKQVWVLDSDPGLRSEEAIEGGFIGKILSALAVYPGPFARTTDAVVAFREGGLSDEIAKWMAMNLMQGEGGLRWIFSPDEIRELLRDFARTDYWELIENRDRRGPDIHFVRAEQSPAVAEESARRIEAAQASGARVFLHRLPGGHWIHRDNRPEVVGLISSFLG